MLEKLLSDDKIVIWGTGKKADFFMKELGKYEELIKMLYEKSLLDQIAFFLDSDNLKQGRFFHNRKSIDPKSILSQKQNKICIVAVLNDKEIIENLILNGHEANINLFKYKDVLHQIKMELMENIFTVLQKLYPDMIKVDRKILLEMEEYKCIKKIKDVCQLVNKNKIINNANHEILIVAIRAYFAVVWDQSENKKKCFEKIRQEFCDDEIISAFSFYYDQNINELAEFFYCDKCIQPSSGKIKTIGIYDERYHNGGGQRFLSLIMPLYINAGYHVVFFTDEYKPEQEYKLPNEVTRIVLEHKDKPNMAARLKEFMIYINKYNIDVMCYHNSFFEERFFYEMCFFKLNKIPVLVELHLAADMLMNLQTGLAKVYFKIYRLADKVVVLSKNDECFWRNFGVNAVYIPNPIENGMKLINQKIPFESRNGNKILWIGRIEQSGKQILDIVPIMLNVVKVFPDVRLQVVGSTDDQSLLEKLKCLIKKYDLGNNIELCGYHKNVDRYYQTADVMLMTSKVEAFPLVIAESKLHGVPLVLYELLNLELLAEKKGYFSVAQKDFEDAAKQLIVLLQNKELRERMSFDAKNSIRSFVEYDIEGEWKEVFNEMN